MLLPTTRDARRGSSRPRHSDAVLEHDVRSPQRDWERVNEMKAAFLARLARDSDPARSRPNSQPGI